MRIKSIIATVLLLFSTMIVPSQGITNNSIKPFSVYLEFYHVFGKDIQSYDIPIGCKVKIIDFDGENFTFCKMGLIKKEGSVETHGPIFDKDQKPIFIQYSDVNFPESMHDLMYISYRYIFEMTDPTIFSFFSSKIHSNTNYNLFPSKDMVGKCGQTSNTNSNVSGSIGLFDSNKQYQYFEIINNKLILKHKLAINPDKYDQKLPFITIQLRLFWSTFQPKPNRYLLLTKDSNISVIGGKSIHYNPPIMVSRNDNYFISTYQISHYFDLGIYHNKDEKYWKIAKIYNPSLDELSYIEMVIKEDDKANITLNGQVMKLTSDWFYPNEYSCPYLNLKDFFSIFKLKYTYRPIDKTVIVP